MGVNQSKKVDPDAARRADLTKWINTALFVNLDENGLKEFENFIADTLQKPNNVKRLKFYCGTPNMDSAFLRECLDGGRKSLTDIEPDDNIGEIAGQVDAVVSYMNQLKVRMSKDLNSDFDAFKTHLRGKLERL